MLKKQLDFIMEGALTKRYHCTDTLKEQNVAEHSFIVAWLLALMYHENDDKLELYQLVSLALLHDLAEAQIGDIASPIKRAHPELKGVLDIAEEGALQASGFNPIIMTPIQKRKLKLADNMEGMLFCVRERFKGNKKIVLAYKNYLQYTKELEPLPGKELELFNLIKELWYDAEWNGRNF